MINYFNGVFSKSLLPSSGGFLDQPATFCSAMQYLSGVKNGIERDNYERDKAKSHG